MNRAAQILLAGLALAGAAGAVYYVSPVQGGDPAAPPVVVAGTTDEVRSRISRLTAQGILSAAGKHERLDGMVRQSLSWSDPETGIVRVFFLDDPLIEVTISLHPAGEGRTAIDYLVRFPDSAFARREELHPYDLKALSGLVDTLLTEYTGSVFEGRRMASAKELEPQLAARIGFDEDQTRGFGKRVDAAFRAAYAARARTRLPEYAVSPAEAGDYEAEFAAEAASEAAQEAAAAASAAAEDISISLPDE